MKITDRLCIKDIKLSSQKDWELITLSQQELEEGIRLGTLQEEQSKKKHLNDRSFHSTEDDSLRHSILAKQSELAVKKWGGGTARVVQINEFHDFPDVGQVNVRYTATSDYGLMLTQKDQGDVPMILTTGKAPNFYLVGWILPDYARQWIYKIHAGRNEDCQSSFGFLNNMQAHESCIINNQLLYPMKTLNKGLVK